MRVARFLHVFAAAFAAVLLTPSAPLAADSTAAKAAAPQTTAKAAPAAPSIRWRAIVAGEAEAKKNGKPALYFFTASWCGPCHLLEDHVFTIPEVAGQIERDFVPIVVQDHARETGRNAPEMLALAERYGLRGFPTLVVSRPNVAANVTLEGWEGPEAAVDFLKTGRKRFLFLERKEGTKK